MATKWTNFSAEVDADSAVSRQGPQCKTCKLLRDLPDDASKQLKLALDHPESTSSSIRRALISRVEERYIPSAFSIARHRRGDCRGNGGGPK